MSKEIKDVACHEGARHARTVTVAGGVIWKGLWASNPPGYLVHGGTLYSKGKGTMKRKIFHTEDFPD